MQAADAHRQPTIISVGLLEFGARLDAVVHAIALLRSEHPTLRYVAVGRPVGAEGERYRQCVLELARDLGVDVRILVVVNEPDDHELAALIATCAAVVVPNPEPAPLAGRAMRTAAALGRPVVVVAPAPFELSLARLPMIVAEPDHDESLADAIHVALVPGAEPVLCRGVGARPAVGTARP